MCSHRYLFTILESGNMFLNSLPAWSAVLKERLCSTRKPEERCSAFSTFWSNFAVVELHQIRLVFFVFVQHPHIPYAVRCPCVCWYHFLLHLQHWNRFRTQFIKQNLHLSGIFEFHTMSLVLWRSLLWIGIFLAMLLFAIFFSRYCHHWFNLVTIRNWNLNEDKDIW